MLGRSGGEVVVTDQQSRFGLSQIRHVQISNVHCTGEEDSIFDCPMKVDVTDAEEGCTRTEGIVDAPLGIICS